MEDASGGEAYYYGNQGEVVKTVRSVMVSQADVRTYVHAATYDSHNRVRTITYPDGEVVTYGYDAAGQVTSLKSTKQGREETIVAQVGYDKDGHTIYTAHGQRHGKHVRLRPPARAVAGHAAHGQRGQHHADAI